MSDEMKNGIEKVEQEAPKPPTANEIFFRNVAALAQVAGAQAFCLSVAFPKEDGTSSVMALAAGVNGTTREWQLEMARLLGEQSVVAAKNIIMPVKADDADVTAPAEVV